MSDIKVTAEDDRLRLFKLLHKRQKGWIPVLVTQGNTGEIVFGVRCIYCYGPEVFELGSNYSPLGCRVAIGIGGKAKLLANVLRNTVYDLERLLFTEYGCA